MLEKSIVEPYPGEFYRCVVGSTLAGTSIGTGDRDEMGICIESPESVIGLEHFEQYRFRAQPEGAKSGVGDLDLTVYSLRKWMRLAEKGNPTIVDLLFVPKELKLINQFLADDLISLTPKILSKNVAKCYLGYLTAQRQRLLGERGGRSVNRPLNDKGFDGKYACHMVRLGVQGVELLRTGKITLPLQGENRDRLIAIRKGEIELGKVLEITDSLEKELILLQETTPLPDHPDRKAINDFLYFAHKWTWQSQEETNELKQQTQDRLNRKKGNQK